MQVLCFGSDYFQALLQPGWAEEKGSTLHMDAAHSAHTFKVVLSWIYTGATPLLEAGDLPAMMRAASFFLLPDLHTECLRMARAALSVHNALGWLLFAEEHQEKELRDATLEYAGANYHRMRRQFPKQCDELIQALATMHPGLLVQMMDCIGIALSEPGVAVAPRKRGREGRQQHLH